MTRFLLPAFIAALLGVPARAEQRPYDDWSRQVDGVLEELRNSRTLNDRLAFQAELATLMRAEVDPEDKHIQKLSAVLPVAPEGTMLDAIGEVLLAKRSRASLEVLFAAFDRTDYVNLQGRKVAENGLETRMRVLEYHITSTADAAAAAAVRGTKVDLPDEVQALLKKELEAANARRVRAAALLIGGWGVNDAVPGLLAAFERLEKDTWTRAILLEAVGRTDPKQASAVVMASVGSSDTSEKLAAIPILGHLEGKDVEKALGKALEDKRWYVSRAAIEACHRRRTPGAAELLIGRLAEASPRIEREIMKVLQDMAGADLPANPPDIAAWWTAVKDRWQPRPADAPPEAPRQGATRTRNVVRYFSQTVDSNRMTLVFDTSGSMSEGRIKVDPPEGAPPEEKTVIGTPFEVMMTQLAGLLKSFRGEFNLISYSDAVKAFKNGLVAANKSNVKAADAFLTGLAPAGETNIYDALMLALDDAEVDTIFLLSDGAPNRGARTAPSDMLEGIERVNRFRKVKINTIQIGADQELMRRIAARNGGTYRNVETQGAGGAPQR